MNLIKFTPQQQIEYFRMIESLENNPNYRKVKLNQIPSEHIVVTDSSKDFDPTIGDYYSPTLWPYGFKNSNQRH